MACDGLWDTITPEEATRLVLQHLRENQTNGGDLENLSAKLATIAKEKVPQHIFVFIGSDAKMCLFS